MTEKLDSFFKELSQTDSRLLLLDYDGTLSPFHSERDKAYPYEGVEERLDKIISLNKTNVVIISGRAIDDLKPLLRLKKYPEMWGSHGRERLTTEDEYSIKKPDGLSAKGFERAVKFIRDNKLDEYMELKPASIAIHFRGVDSKKVLEISQKVLDNWSRVGAEFNLVIDEFDGGLELKIRGVNKGTAVKEIFAVYPSHTIGAYLGDDLTDEDAFKALPKRILGILAKEVNRETAAQMRIKPPKELLSFLDRWIEIDENQ